MPLETHDQRFYFSTEPLRSYSLCNMLSDEKIAEEALTSQEGFRSME
jgi:hypothetical protein